MRPLILENGGGRRFSFVELTGNEVNIGRTNKNPSRRMSADVWESSDAASAHSVFHGASRRKIFWLKISV